MCGFVVEKQATRALDETALASALRTLGHRGPDHTALWLSEDRQTGMGHARLSIIDLAGGNQPIVNPTYGLSLVVNGELYDYQLIRKELQAKGYVFQTRADSEIILFLYLEYGLELFEHLRGEFAFVLYDARRDLLLAGRDRFGIKPLCYFHDGEKLLISSEAKALFALGVPRAWDPDNFMHAATLQYQPTGGTFFRDIHQLSPGHRLVYRHGTLDIRPYWDLDYPPEATVRHEASDGEAIEAFRERLTESIRLRLVSDVPVCFHLSGGLDSSAVVGLARPWMTDPMHCFTVAFDGQAHYDELALARQTAAFTDSELHIVNVGRDDILAHLEAAVYYSEGLAVNGHITAKYLLNQAIRHAGFKVALTGEGADEVLAGYPHLRQDLLDALPAEATAERLRDLYKTNPVSIGIQLAHGDGLDVAAIQRQLGFVPAFLKAKASFGLKMRSVLSEDLLSRYRTVDFYAEMLRAYDGPNQLQGRSRVNQSLYLWTKLTLANYILNTLGDGCEMAHGVEGRLPFLDHKLFEWSRTLPMHLKIRDNQEKYILKEAARSDITPEVYKRQKHPFMAPPVLLNATPESLDFIRDHLTSQAFRTMPFFDTSNVSALLDRLPGLDRETLTAQEPVIMFLLTAFFLHKRFGLC